MLAFDEIRRVHVELTTRCNARCPMCVRNYRGYDYNSGYPLCELSLQDFQKIFPPDVLGSIMQSDPPVNGLIPRKYDFQGFLFNGNLGDFGSARDGAEIVSYLVDHGVPVSINTNGSVRSPAWWARLALPNVEIGFALDGLADTHHLYRQDTDWSRILANARAFIDCGGRAVWRFVPFDHNRHQEQACRELSERMGFVRFENIYDGRDNTPVFTRDGKFSHQIGEDSRPQDAVPDLQPLLQNHITWFDHRTVTLTTDRPELNIQCIHKRNREIYVAADGSVYPCCYLGFYPSTMTHPGNAQLKSLTWENNALQHSLQHCMEWFDAVEQSWARPSIRDGRLFACVKHCAQ